MKNNFQIFVGVFPVKTAYKNSSTIDIYQLNKLVYELAQEVNTSSDFNEIVVDADSFTGDDCDSGVVNCDEKLIGRPPPPTCVGPPGPPGPAGPRGFTGEDGADAICQQGGPCPPCRVPKEYCGYLPAPPPPPPGTIPVNCHCEDVRGYIVNSGANHAQTCNLQNIENVSLYTAGFSCDAWSFTPESTFCRIPTLGDDNPFDDCDSFFPLCLLGNFGGGPQYKYQFTWCEYLQLANSTQASTCNWWKPGVSGDPTNGVTFIPYHDLYGFTQDGVSNSNYSNYQVFLQTWGQNDGGVPPIDEDYLQEFFEYYPDCDPGSGAEPPPITDQGDIICRNGVSPPATGGEGTCAGTCPNPITDCAEPRDGDKFIDLTNGVTYYFLDGQWQKQGMLNCGNSACKKCPDRPPPCPPCGGGGGCDCEQCESEGCDLGPGPPGSPPPPPGTLKCCAEGETCKGPCPPPTECEGDAFCHPPCPECPPPDGGSCPPGTSCRGPCPPPGGNACPAATPLCCVRCATDTSGYTATIMLGNLVYEIIGPID